MATFVLKFEDQVLRDCPVGLIATIGRLPDNSIVIENPAVSGHHACVFRDGEQFVVEDLESTNGTFVNEKRVTRHMLQAGDVLLVGKHELVFDPVAGGEPIAEPEPAMSSLGDTVFLDTRKHRALMAMLTDPAAGSEAPGADGTASLDATTRIGVLRVLDGRADRAEYQLDARTSLIGKADTSVVRLKGWFKPRVAAAITRNGHGYMATVLAGNASINSQAVSGRYDLKDGDILRVSGLTLEFRLKGSA
jgi:pSer/pThr/pTyr-binding forkhead associated (FHA) protein